MQNRAICCIFGQKMVRNAVHNAFLNTNNGEKKQTQAEKQARLKNHINIKRTNITQYIITALSEARRIVTRCVWT